MAKKTIKCPNCRGPLVPDSAQETIVCQYCNHHLENPLYKAKQVQVATEQQTAAAKRVVLVIAIVVGLSILTGVVIPIIVGVAGEITVAGCGQASNFHLN